MTNSVSVEIRRQIQSLQFVIFTTEPNNKHVSETGTYAHISYRKLDLWVAALNLVTILYKILSAPHPLRDGILKCNPLYTFAFSPFIYLYKIQAYNLKTFHMLSIHNNSKPV
jgi:hypothetical protein